MRRWLWFVEEGHSFIVELVMLRGPLGRGMHHGDPGWVPVQLPFGKFPLLMI